MKIKEAVSVTVSNVQEAAMKSTIKNWHGCFFVILFFVMMIISCRKQTPCNGCADKPPIASTNPDQFIILPNDSAVLDGSSSSDPDGTITKWLWQKISGPSSFTIVNPAVPKTVVRKLVFGVYRFELTVTDNHGLSAKDTMMVTVDSTAVPKHPPLGSSAPVANAGVDQVIVLPANSIILDGSRSIDSNNNIASYLWTKISGPSSYFIANTNAIQTAVNNLVEGVYQFELKVTDSTALSGKDTVRVTVMEKQPSCTNCKITFVSRRDGNDEIYSCNIDGSNAQRLTNEYRSDLDPAWSPDGTRIAFVSNRLNFFDLYVMNADGSNVVQRTLESGDPLRPDWTGDAFHPTWSPDGTMIAYYTNIDYHSFDIWVVGATSGSPTLLFKTAGDDRYPAWSPDGTKIAFASDWPAFDSVHNIYVINANGTGFTGIPLINRTSDSIEYVMPSWSPDGSKIAFLISRKISTYVFDTQIGVMNADGSGFKVITSGTSQKKGPSWSNDGSKITYTLINPTTNADLLWVSPDGSSSGIFLTNGDSANWQH
jgi:hypothetical protein